MKPGDPIPVGFATLVRDGHTYHFVWRLDRAQELSRCLGRFAADAALNFTWDDAARVAYRAAEIAQMGHSPPDPPFSVRGPARRPTIPPPDGWLLWMFLFLVLVQGCFTRLDLTFLRQSVERKAAVQAEER